MRRNFLLVLAAVVVLLKGSTVAAQAAEPTIEPAPRPLPYSMPFQLRSAGIATLLRLDTAIAGSDAGATVVPMFAAAYKAWPTVSFMFRMGYSANFPSGANNGGAFTNPLIAVTYAPAIAPEWKLALFGAVAAPLGQGGGDSPNADTAAALGAGRLARSALDNTMFGVNYATVVGGVGAAYLVRGFTFQAEVTLLQGFRARGPDSQDGAVTNSTENLWIGYTLLPQFSFGVELRHQHFLSTPAAVRGNAAVRDQTSLAIGARTRIAIGDSLVLPIGVSYSRAIDSPMSAAHYNVFFVDVPVVFQ